MTANAPGLFSIFSNIHSILHTRTILPLGMAFRFGFGIFLFVGFVFTLLGQQTGYSVKGQVTDHTGEAIPGVAVYFHETRRGVYTDSIGNFHLRFVKPGTYHLHVEALGYQPLARTLAVNQDLFDLHLVLNPSELKTGEVIIESESDKRAYQESSQTFSVVNRNFLENYSTGNLVNTLERLPGVNAIRTGVGISKPVIRGMSFNRVLVIDNGIRQEGQQWGADHGLELDEWNADRVEVLRGPGAVQHGSDAIGGVILIRQAPLPQAGTWQASALLTARTLNDLWGGSWMAGAQTGGISWRVRAGVREYGDYRVPASRFNYNRYVLPIYNNQLKNTAGKEENLSFTAGIQRNWGSTQVYATRFHQQAGFFSGAFGIPRAVSLLPDGNTRNIAYPRQVTTHSKISMRSNILFRKNWLEIDAGFQRNDRREEALPHFVGQQSTSDLALNLVLDTWSATTRYHHSLSQAASLITGFSGQYQHNRVGGFEHLLPEYHSLTGGAFVLGQYKPHPDWVWNAGLRYDAGNVRIPLTKTLVYNKQGIVTDTLLRNRASHRIFANVTGSGGVAWNPNEHWAFKSNLSSDFRFPTVAELASNGVHHGTFRHVLGNASLAPERGFQGDVSGEWKDRKFRLAFSPFFSYFLNYIYLSPSGRFSYLSEGGQIYSYQEASARFFGGEAEVEYALSPSLHFHTIFEYVNALNLDTRIPLPFTPPGNVSVEGTWDRNIGKHTLFLSLTFQAFADQNRTDRNEPATPGYGLWHLSSGATLKAGKQKVRILIQVQNLTDRAYLQHMSRYRMLEIPEPGRNLVFTLSIPLEGKFNTEETGD